MPERVIALTEARVAQGKRTKLTIGSALSLGSHAENTRPDNTDRSEEVAKALREHAFQFFLHHGGNVEDWGDENEDSFVEELTKRWKESEWGQLWERRHRRKKGPQATLGSVHWFGTSFEVGNLLGLNVMNGQEHVTNKSIPSTRKSQSSVLNDGTRSIGSVAPTTHTGKQTFATAPSTLELRETRSSDYLDSPDIPPSPASATTSARDANLTTKYDAAKIAEPFQVNVKGKSKMVHYADLDRDAVSIPGPVAPETVLERTYSTVDQNTSMAATVPDAEHTPTDTSDEINWGDVVLRDRMLVRASFTKSESLPYFTDEVNRTTRNLSFEDWGEFLVAWRRDVIEIYRDYRTFGSCKDWAVGHKHLSYVIPLKSSRTRLSLYSFVDLTFCITCAPTTTKLNATASRWIFNKDKEGTNIFVFKLKSRSRAYDWSWQLWYFILPFHGGQIPRTIDIHSPRLSTKVTIDVPENEEMHNGSLYKIFKRENILDLCMNSLRKVPDWDYLMENELAKGKSLQLAWRVDANLDWIWLETDVYERPRDWAVLCGLPFKHHPVLEVRLAEHNSNYIHLRNGRQIDEPPAIEGYLDRIRPNTQTKQQVYLSTHNGYLFTLDPFFAYPPMPPGLAPVADVYADAQALRQAEIGRGTNQLISATGVCDLRTIVAVRRASHPTSSHMHKDPEERDGDDDGDEGGESGLSKHGDRTRLRTKRSFELLLKTGHVVRFEAHSCQVALEWVERLRALIFYWKSRHRNDAKQEIDLAQAQRPRLTPQTRVFEDEHEYPPDAPPDPSTIYGAVDRLYNWCALEVCRPITKGGRIYMKKGLHGQYQYVLDRRYCAALSRCGTPCDLPIGTNSSLYPVMRKKINLLDAYVCSGYFAAQTLPKGQYLPNTDLVGRRYQDGLETDDREEDMLFMIWYRQHSQMSSAAQDPTTIPIDIKVPTLSAKSKMLVFKARSILERDSWCWALNSEIEKIVRAQKKREEKLRETGNLVKLK
ncbi:Pleckstrin homology domain-containing protein [Gymnopilus junonius]|uniref:Pleckstrin homology domain-containing protein n=1 Tax=Gymnopilus junonius TaxID=109634 RepID=A0A9P5NYD4_GYMJU|nr:Pleckstrin homology domain-containing protein [Gymnopilus junonius]